MPLCRCSLSCWAFAVAVGAAACTDVTDPSTDVLVGDVPRDDATGPDAVVTTLPLGWPWPAAAATVPPHGSWKNTLDYPEGARFLAADAATVGPYVGAWAKLTVLTGDPSAVYFQDLTAYPQHYDFGVERLPPLAGLDPAGFDAATLDGADQRAILGVLFAPRAPARRELGVELLGRQPYPPDVVAAVLDLVARAVVPLDGEPPPALFYFPSFDQAPAVAADAAAYDARGVAVSGPERWANGDVCYLGPWVPERFLRDRHWAVGRLRHVPAAALAAALAAGELGADEILLTDVLPTELPPVAGVLSFAPSHPHSRASALAATWDIPLAFLPDPDEQAAVRALDGHLVAVRARPAPARRTVGACDVDVRDLERRVPDADLAAIVALKAPARIALPARTPRGALTAAPEALAAADVSHFGGESVRFGALRRALPDDSPAGAVAVSFDLWDALAATPPRHDLVAPAGSHLLGEPWGTRMGDLSATLAAIRAELGDAVIAPAQRDAILAALAAVDPYQPVVVRASTNAEAVPGFTGAAFYESAVACLADDLDHDVVGPSHCDPRHAAERGVSDAIRAVFASAYALPAYLERQRRGVDEERFAVGVLITPVAAAAELRASGMVTVADVHDRAYVIVSQAAQVGVATARARPEIAMPAAYPGPPVIIQWSALRPLGTPVLDWTERDYATLAALAGRMIDSWPATSHPGTPLGASFDFELRAAGGAIALTRVQLARANDPTATVRPYLLPSPTTRALCVTPDQRTSISALHRAKVRLGLDNVGAWLDPEGLDRAYLTRVSYALHVEGEQVAVEAVPAALPGWTWQLTPGADGTRLVMGWTHGDRGFALSHAVPGRVSRDVIPLTAIEELALELTVTYATPQLNLPFGDIVSEDVVALGPCADGPVAGEVAAERVVATGGVTIEARVFYTPTWPPPVGRFGAVRIAGLTAEPFTLHDDGSRTFGIRSLYPLQLDLLFEPGLDPDLDPAVRAALEAADVWQIEVADTPLGGAIALVGFDGRPRSLAAH